MKNWVELVQNTTFNGPSDLDAALLKQIEMNSDLDEDDDYGSEGLSDVLDGIPESKKKKAKN